MREQRNSKAPFLNCDLGQIVQDALDGARSILDDRRHSLRYLDAREAIPLSVDRASIVRALEALFESSAMSLPTGGELEVSCRRVAGWALVRLKTTASPGAEATEAPAKSLAEPRVAFDLVRQWIEAEGGVFTGQFVDGESQGEFIVSLPVPEPPTLVTTPVQDAAPTRPLRILVVDDNVGSAKVLAKLLTRLWGHLVEQVHCGEAALDAVDRFDPEVIFLDIGLPDMSGHDVVRSLSSAGKRGERLLIALTGYGLDEDRLKSFEVGFDEHLLKPASIETLQRMLSHSKLRSARE